MDNLGKDKNSIKPDKEFFINYVSNFLSKNCSAYKEYEIKTNTVNEDVPTVMIEIKDSAGDLKETVIFDIRWFSKCNDDLLSDEYIDKLKEYIVNYKNVKVIYSVYPFIDNTCKPLKIKISKDTILKLIHFDTINDEFKI